MVVAGMGTITLATSLGSGDIPSAPEPPAAAPAADVGAGARAKEVHSVLDARAAGARTTAVTETAEGTRVVSSSEKRLTPAQRATLKPGEVEGTGAGHAEVTGVNAARKMGLTPTGAGASRPICPTCAKFLTDEGLNHYHR